MHSKLAMADYSSLKVPELKKLLGERGLVTTGDKADLIARLQDSDKSTPPAKAPGPCNQFPLYSDDCSSFQLA